MKVHLKKVVKKIRRTEALRIMDSVNAYNKAVKGYHKMKKGVKVKKGKGKKLLAEVNEVSAAAPAIVAPAQAQPPTSVVQAQTVAAAPEAAS